MILQVPLSTLSPQLPNVEVPFDIKTVSLIYIPAVLLTLIIGKIIYLRHFHPLARFPGPFLGSITNFYQAYIIATGKLELYELEWHRKYGPVVRIRPNYLSSSDPRHIPLIYHKDADKTNFQDLPSFGFELAIASQRDHKHHAFLKKRIAPAFSLKVVKESEGLVDLQITTLLKELDRRYLSGTCDGKNDGVLDIAPWTQYLAYDVITELAFDDNKGFLKANKDVDGLIGELLKALKGGIIISAVADLFLEIYNEPLGIGRRLLNTKQDPNSGLGRILSFAQAQIDQRKRRIREGKPVRNDLVNHIMNLRDPNPDYDSKEPGPLVSDAYVRSELTVITFAGSDTTAANIRTIVLEVLRNPSIKAKLIAEIDSCYERGTLTGKIASYDQLNAKDNCPYLYAVLEESRRFRAPAPIILPRKVAAPGMQLPIGNYGDNVYIPAGADIGCNSMVTTRDTNFYGPDAEVFKPERWLESLVGEKRVIALKRADITFGAGSRTCLGKNIAWMELVKTISSLFRLYELDLVPPPPGEKPYHFENYSLWHESGIWIKIKRRNVPEWFELDEATI